MTSQSERRPLDPDQREALRQRRHESRTSSTYKQLLKDLRAKGFASEPQGELALTSVLCALEQRLTSDHAFKLESQLPEKLKELLVRCERHQDLRPRDIGRPEFLQLVLHGMPGGEQEAEKAVRAVFETLAEHVTPGEVQKLIHQLPADLRELWPDWARAIEEVREPPKSSRRRAAATESAPEVVAHVFELTVRARLGVLRSIAPRILADLDEEERAGFLRDLSDEIDRALRGEETYDIRRDTGAAAPGAD